MIGVESERTTFVSCTGESLHVERVSELRPDVASWVEAIRSRSSSDDAGCASVRDGRCVLIDGDHTVFEFSASGQQIEVWSDGTRSDRYLDHMLRDHVVPRRLSLRGERILHATAVAVHGVAVAFVGPSTAGKSTLAAAFAAEGATVLADDTLRLRLDTDRTLVLPTSDTSRLREDSAAALEAPMTAVRSRPLRSAENAVIVRGPVPLGLICLVDRGAVHLRLAPVAPSHALVSLARSAFLPEAHEIDPTTALDLFLPVLQNTRVVTLSYPNGFGVLPDLVELIVRSVRADVPLESDQRAALDSPSTCLKGGIHANSQDL